MNPSFAQTADGSRYVVFCRYRCPPVPGESSIWIVGVDAEMTPVGRPMLLLNQGIDPRVVAHGDRLVVFLAFIDRDAEARIVGSNVAMAEFEGAPDRWTCVRIVPLPKRPLAGLASVASNASWEKNWVPFALDAQRLAVIYAHDPWTVLTMDIADRQASRFLDAFAGPAVTWSYGTVRGGTPPVRYDDAHLVTFFHAAQVVGSRRLYTAGACVFRATAPFTPVRQTFEPLLVAPYRSGAHRFGWTFAGSVVFPAGAAPTQDGFRLIAGLDDGEIATFDIGRADLEAALAPVIAAGEMVLCDAGGGTLAALPAGPALRTCDPARLAGDLPVLDFLRVLTAGGARTLVDIGAGEGMFTVLLAPMFERAVAFEPDERLCAGLRTNLALNAIDGATCECVRLQAEDSLDARKILDVDVLKIDAASDTAGVLRGCLDTLRHARPCVLMRVVDTDTEPQSILQAQGYLIEALFPRTPDWVLAIAAERRDAYAWFI